MDSNSIPLALWAVLAIVISGFQIGFGAFFGRWLAVRRFAGEMAKAAEDREKIDSLTARVNTQVAQHAERVESIQNELTSVTSGEEEAYGKVVASAAMRLMEANEQLQAELAAARRELEQQAARMESQRHEARTDPLTLLLNRRAFDENFQHCFEQWSESREGGFLVLADIDHFKQFNDSYGHPLGDKVLRHVGRVLRDATRGLDVSVARYGGEEFALILPNASFAMARRAAEEIRQAVETTVFQDGDQQMPITISVGMAQAARGDQAESLIARADQALYKSKDAGRNCGHFHDGIEIHRLEIVLAHEPESPVDAVEAAVEASVSPVIAAETEQVTDRRRRQRLKMSRSQFIAPYSGEGKPNLQAFREVEVHDISPSGFSFLGDAPPEFEHLVAALGAPPHITYLTAQIVHTTVTKIGNGTKFLAGCRFTGRIETESREEEPAGAGV